jgi:hypothetical protein
VTLPRGGRTKYGSAEQRLAAKKRQRVAACERGKKERRENPLPTRASMGIHQYKTPDIPPELLADAERIKHLSHSTIVGHLMGDPLPGRSALDKSRSGT